MNLVILIGTMLLLTTAVVDKWVTLVFCFTKVDPGMFYLTSASKNINIHFNEWKCECES